MVRELQSEELQTYLQELNESRALEIQFKSILPTVPGGAKEEVLLPYMMNDAVEYYIRLTNARMRGEWNPAAEGMTEIALTQNGQRKGLLLRQCDGNVVSVWYDQALFEGNNYQYHRIGHAWRDVIGEDHYRRLVNLLCVLHDKYHYLGENFCNEKEIDLCHLIEFGPLCYWTPINDSIMDWYPETEKGIESMARLAKDAGDQSYAEEVENYRASSPKKRKKIFEKLAKSLLKEEHGEIFWLLEEKIKEASVGWNKRVYADRVEAENRKAIKTISDKYISQGYQGTYPLFYSPEKIDKKIIYCVEEHPFTIMESEDYCFRIHVIDSVPEKGFRLTKKSFASNQSAIVS